MKILSVDDSGIVRKMIRGAVEVLGYELQEAEDGFEAIDKLNEENNIDLILLDWNMPGMSGYELLTKLKNDNRLKKIPVMMVTTEGQKENIVAAVKAGAINYMTKPFTMDEITKKILECFGKGDL